MWLPFLVQDTFSTLCFLQQFCTQEKRSEKSYFMLFYKLFVTSRLILFIWSISKSSKSIEVLLNKLTTSFYHDISGRTFEHKKSIKVKYYLWFFGVVDLLLLIVMIIFSSQPGGKMDFPIEVFHSRISMVKEAFFEVASDSNHIEYSTHNVFLGLLATWFQIAHGLVNCVSRIFLIGLYPVIIWTVVKDFVCFIENVTFSVQTNTVLQVIVNKFEEVKYISDELNKIFSESFLVFIFEAVFQCMFTFDQDNQGSLNWRDLIEFLITLISLIFQIIGLVACADVYLKVHS